MEGWRAVCTLGPGQERGGFDVHCVGYRVEAAPGDHGITGGSMMCGWLLWARIAKAILAFSPFPCISEMCAGWRVYRV